MSIYFIFDQLAHRIPIVDQEYMNLIQEYNRKFGKNIPTEMLPPQYNCDIIKDMIKRSLKADRDIVSEELTYIYNKEENKIY